jgi:hypothetical protein
VTYEEAADALAKAGLDPDILEWCPGEEACTALGLDYPADSGTSRWELIESGRLTVPALIADELGQN